MTNTGKMDKFRIWNAASEIFGVFEFDKFIMFTLYNCNWDADLGQIACRVIGLCSLHESHRFGKFVELIWRGG